MNPIERFLFELGRELFARVSNDPRPMYRTAEVVGIVGSPAWGWRRP